MVEVSHKTKLVFLIFVSTLVVAVVAVLAFLAASGDSDTSRGPTSPQSEVNSKAAPKLVTEIVAENLNHPWDIAFLPDKSVLITERGGTLRLIEEGDLFRVASINDVYSRGEAGLMGLEVDNEFASNRYIYTCYASTNEDVRLVRWKLGEDKKGLSSKMPIVTDIPLNSSGRHSGCRVRMDSQNTLWVGTGDAAIGTNPQDPESLGGKVLHVTRSGEPVEGNLSSPFDQRIFSYGHRNVQGLALYDSPRGDNAGFSVEHGPDVDDEVNPLLKGNFGWDPVPFYNEDVPMTDLEQYPEAVKAVWRSGTPTVAPSGATFIQGRQWQGYNGALAVATLKDQHLRIQQYDHNSSLVRDDVVFENDFGRLRSVRQNADGVVYLTTDNGRENDKIITVKPE